MKRAASPDVRVPIMTPLFQAYSPPPSCKAKRRGIGQATESIAPIISKLARRSFFVLSSSTELGMERNRMTIAVATIGPLQIALVPNKHRQMPIILLNPKNPSPCGSISYHTTKDWTKEICNCENGTNNPGV